MLSKSPAFGALFAAAALFVCNAPSFVLADDLGKPTLYSDGLSGPLSAYSNIKTAGFYGLQDSSVPQICKDYGAIDNACAAENIEAREVRYDDCEQSWTLCRCKDAELSFDRIRHLFGQVPPTMRSYVGAVLAVHADGPSAVCYNGNFLRFHGDCTITVILHEASHALDKGLSDSAEFKDAVNADTCVADGYANSGLPETWAQAAVVYGYTQLVGPLDRDPTTCMGRQWATLENNGRVNEAFWNGWCRADYRPFLTPNELTRRSAEPSAQDDNIVVRRANGDAASVVQSAKFRLRSKVRSTQRSVDEPVVARGWNVTLPYRG